MALIVLRCVFLILAVGVGATLIRSDVTPSDPAWAPWAVFLGVMVVSAAVILLDMYVPAKRIDTISAVYFGILVGLFLTYAVRLALAPLFEPGNQVYLNSSMLVLGACVCYFCISVLLQTKDDFRFIIPYVEFAKEVKGLRPYVIDTSVIIDGRIADVVKTHLLDNQLIMPRFVLTELQSIADSNDRLRRTRGRRGLDILNELRASKEVELNIYDRELPEMKGETVDMKLVLLAKHLDGKVITGDYNLNKVARLQNVPVINLNDVANALKPAFLPGENINVKIVKPGEQPGQGVGYLDDGTMIVVESGRDHIGEEVSITVTNIVQSSAGRMVFGKYVDEESTEPVQT